MTRRGKQLAWLIVFLSFVVSLVGCTLPSGDLPPEETIVVTGAPTDEVSTDSGEVSTPTPVLPTSTPETTPVSTETQLVIVTPTPTPTAQPTATVKPVVTLQPIVVPTSVLTPTKSPTQAPTSTKAPTPTPTPTNNTPISQAAVYCRGVLNQSQRAAYDKIVTALSNPNNIQTVNQGGGTQHQIKVSVNYNASTSLSSELELILSAVIMDHPEFFYLSKQYSYPDTGNCLTDLYLFTLDRSTALSLQAQVNAGIQAYQQQVSPYQDPYEIAKQYYELLATNIDYKQDGTDHAYSIVGAFVNGQCVCEGFSEAYQLLLNAYGIRAFTVSGEAGGPHQWIAVEINGRWYYSDPTWADLKSAGIDPKTGYVCVSYAYLNLTATQMGLNHTLDTLPSTFTAGLDFTATQDNYFVREGGFFQNFQQNEVETYLKQAITDALANNRETVGVRMGNKQAYGALLAYIQQNLYRVYYYEVGGPTVNLTYVPDETSYTVHIVMH